MIIQQIGDRGDGLRSREQIQEALDLVTSDLVTQSASSGRLALVLFRPKLGTAVLEGLFESEASDMDIINHFLQQKFSGFSVARLVHVELDDKFVTELYGRNSGAIERMQTYPAYPESHSIEGIDNSWDSLLYTMISGVSTLALMGYEKENATSHARVVIGTHGDLEKRNKGLPYSPEGIRPTFARSGHNNLMHGSDTSDDVLGELGVFAKFLVRLRSTGSDG